MKSNLATLTLTVIAAGLVAANRLVTQAGAYPTAGGLAFGVTRSDGAAGDPLPVDVHGTALIEAGGTIVADTPLMVGTDGKVVAHDLDGDKHAIGRSLGAAVAGDLVEVLLVPSAGVLVTAA